MCLAFRPFRLQPPSRPPDRFHTLPLSVVGFRVSPVRASPLPSRLAARARPNRVHLRCGLVVHLPLLSTPPRGDAVSFSYRPERVARKGLPPLRPTHLQTHWAGQLACPGYPVRTFSRASFSARRQESAPDDASSPHAGRTSMRRMSVEALQAEPSGLGWRGASGSRGGRGANGSAGRSIGHRGGLRCAPYAAPRSRVSTPAQRGYASRSAPAPAGFARGGGSAPARSVSWLPVPEDCGEPRHRIRGRPSCGSVPGGPARP